MFLTELPASTNLWNDLAGAKKALDGKKERQGRPNSISEIRIFIPDGRQGKRRKAILWKAAPTTLIIPNHMVLWLRLATCSFASGGAMRPSISNLPGSCHSVGLARALLFVQAAPIFGKKGHCNNLFRQSQTVQAAQVQNSSHDGSGSKLVFKQ